MGTIVLGILNIFLKKKEKQKNNQKSFLKEQNRYEVKKFKNVRVENVFSYSKVEKNIKNSNDTNI